MKYEIKVIEENSTDFPQWSFLENERIIYQSRGKAERVARDLNDYAWQWWDKENPDATEADRLWAVDHAPCFVVVEIEE